MNWKYRKGTAVALVAALALGLSACGGGGGNLTNEIRDLKEDLATAQGERDDARTEVTRLMGELETAGGNITRLEGELETANGNVTRLTGELETANGNVTRLEGELETANGNVTRLTGELETANGRITELEGEVERLEGQLATEGTIRGLFATAQSSTTNSTNAGTAATDAVKAATEAEGKLGVIGSAGDSATEMANAQAIMTAKANADQAVIDAQAALDAAEAARTRADGLDAGAQKTAVIEALDAAIVVATAQLKIATDARDSDDLSDAVDEVTGGKNADPQGTPASLAKAVAEAVAEALGAKTTAAGIPVPASGSELEISGVTNAIVTTAANIPATTVKNVTRMSNASGMTWAMIVGEANTMKQRLGTITAGSLTAGNAELSVMSIAGMDASAVDKTTTAVLSATGGTGNDGEYDDAFSTTATVTGTSGTEYKGIPGVVVCLGGSDGCSVSEAGKLSAGWYFTPASAMALYVKGTDDATTPAVDESKSYVQEPRYVRYGYWLTFGERDSTDGSTADVALLNRYMVLSGTDTNTANLDFSKTDGMPDSATYRGEAGGMSVHKVLDSDGDITQIDSGAFTADAELVLRFGDGQDITLGGTIDNFQSDGANTDSGWTIELERKVVVAAGTLTDNIGKTVASGRDGQWSAQAYGADGARPTGIYGAFNAHFSDGHAGGVYATKK